MLLPRVLTALVFVPLVTGAVWCGSIPFFLLVAVVCLFSLWEFLLMAEQGGYPNRLWVGILGGALVIAAFYLDGAPAFPPIDRAPSPFFVLVVWFFVAFLREFAAKDKSYAMLRIFTTASGVMLCAFLMGHLLLIRDIRLVEGEGFAYVGRAVTFFLFCAVWAVDTGAWAVGQAIGRTPLAPRMSPKKTWEGTLGGVLIAGLVGWIFRDAFLAEAFSRKEAVLFSVGIAAVAQISDLSESMIKRSFGLKNSSEILPGHGGVFDRFDSFLFAAPFFYYTLLSTGRFQ